jgi:hypothetical protein
MIIPKKVDVGPAARSFEFQALLTMVLRSLLVADEVV